MLFPREIFAQSLIHFFKYHVMKRFLLAAAALMLFFSVQASAQGFGVTAGMNFNTAKIADVRTDAKAGWNVGVTYGLDLPLGFSVQPSLVFIQKSADYSGLDGAENSAFTGKFTGIS